MSCTDSIKSLYNPNLDYTKQDPPHWTMSGRNFPPNAEKKIPAPNYYKPEKVNIHLKNSPHFTMGVKYSEFCSTGLPAHFQSEGDLF